MMLKFLIYIIATLAALIVWGVSGEIGKEVAKTVFSESKQTPQEIEEKLIKAFEEAAKKVNKTTPIMVDKDTRMDKATVGPGPRATYHYTFPKYSSQDISSVWLLQNLRPIVVKNVCNNKDMQLSLKYGGIYAYSYSGNDGVLISIFEINKTDCGI